MKVSIQLTRDSHNTYPTDMTIGIYDEEVEIEVNDRKVSVRKSDLIKVLRLMED